MANLINKDYFFGRRLIAQTTEASVEAELNQTIAELEPKVLTCLLGATLYKEYLDALAATLLLVPVPLAQKWIELRDGVASYTDKYGIKQTWFGLYNNTSKKSLIANYVYFYWARDHITSSTGTGEKTSDAENATNAYPMFKQNDAWREMVQWNKSLRLFLQSHTNVYDTWSDPLTRPIFPNCKDLFYSNNNLNL